MNIEQPLSKEEKLSIYLATFLAALGYGIALFTCSDVFARFGALIVCVGVYFGAKGFILRSNSFTPISDKLMMENIQKCMDILDTRKSDVSENLIEEAKLKFLESCKKIENKKNRSVYALEKRVIRIESGIIMAGTLIWAFGDYVVLESYASCL